MTAKNYNAGKERPSLVLKDMSKALESLLRVREKGAVKYDRLNFRESIGTPDAERFMEDNLDSLARHFLKRLQGEIYDQETGEPHSAHIMCRSGFDVEYTEAEAVQPKAGNPCPHDSITNQVCDDCEGYIDRIPVQYEWGVKK